MGILPYISIGGKINLDYVVSKISFSFKNLKLSLLCWIPECCCKKYSFSSSYLFCPNLKCWILGNLNNNTLLLLGEGGFAGMIMGLYIFFPFSFFSSDFLLFLICRLRGESKMDSSFWTGLNSSVSRVRWIESSLQCLNALCIPVKLHTCQELRVA